VSGNEFKIEHDNFEQWSKKSKLCLIILDEGLSEKLIFVVCNKKTDSKLNFIFKSFYSLIVGCIIKKEKEILLRMPEKDKFYF
jgi:hypothetical protein